MRRLAVSLCVAMLAAELLSAQQQAQPSTSDAPPITFRAEVNYIETDALVTDRKGNVVKDLTRDDFEVREDGKPQTISSFSLVDIPVQPPARTFAPGGLPIERDVQTNAQLEGRIYLILLDDLHTDLMRTPRVKATLRRFIEQDFGENDVAAVVFTGGRSVDAQEFTNDPRLVLAAIDRFAGQKLPSAEIERLRSATDVDVDAAERAHRAQTAMATIRRLAAFMANIEGRRKAMLFVSEGIDYDIANLVGPDPRGGPSDFDPTVTTMVFEETRDAIAAATRSNVNIYAIDPRGPLNGTEELIQASSARRGSNGSDASLKTLLDEQRRSQDSLRELATSTGGFAAVNTNGLDAALGRLVRENSTYYLIGYYSTNDARNGKFRTIDVRVKRPGLTVRSRKGYMAPKGNAPAATPVQSNPANPSLAEALGSPLPVGGVPMRLYAAVFRESERVAAIPIAIELDASRFTFVQKDGTFNDKVDVLYSATDARDNVVATDRNTVNLALKPETYERIKATGLRVIAQMDLAPGRYRIHVAAGDASGNAGSVVDDIEVPDFSKAPLSMSGVALTSQAAADVITIASKNPLKDLMAGPITAIRDFRTGDSLTTFGEVYDATKDASLRAVDIKTELRDGGGTVLYNTTEQRPVTEAERGSGAYRFSARIPLADATPGLYVIHVEASRRAGSRAMVSRDIPIRVR